jgi:hypothetical protein
VIAGQLQTSGGSSVVAPLVAGMAVGSAPVLSSSSGIPECSPLHDPTSIIEFGRDRVQSCVARFTNAQLSSRCAANGPGFADYLIVNATHVGSWGSSDPLNAADWIAIDAATFSTASQSWTASTTSSTGAGTCTGIATILNVEFLVVRLGAKSNPQNKVVGARISYDTATIVVPDLDTSVDVEMRTVVTFAVLPEGGSQEVIPQAPPLLPKLPRDVLYPLFISSALSAFKSPTGFTLLSSILFTFTF